MKVIGLTGGIGTGKSTVAGFLEELGAAVIYADKLGHQLLESDAGARQQLAAAFGQEILTPGGQIDRKKLGAIVFDSAGALARLNGIMHPPIALMAEARLEQYRRQGVAAAVIEAPLLMEAGWTDMVDEVWVTAAPRAVVLRRLKEGMGLGEKESLARIGCQLPAAEQVKMADVVIDTNLSRNELKNKIAALWKSSLISS